MERQSLRFTFHIETNVLTVVLITNNWYKKQLQGIILLLQTAPRDRERVFGDYRTPLQIQRTRYPQALKSSVLTLVDDLREPAEKSSPILDAFKSKIHTTLNNATISALNAVGGGTNSSAVAAFIHPERGFLVYDVFVLDSSNNVHRVIIDPGNGRVLSNQQMSMMDMMFMMHHPSMGMGSMMMGGGHGMDMMQHGMMMGGGHQGMMRPFPSMMMGHDMGMMGGPLHGGG